MRPLTRRRLDCARHLRAGAGYLDFFEGIHSPEHFAREAARTAILQLKRSRTRRRDACRPRARMAGVLLHEAVGHGLEADFNRKKTSAFAGLLPPTLP